MSDVICPSCGKRNPDSLEFCQFCRARLISQPGPLDGEGLTPQSSGLPDTSSTSDQESALPGWLRTARESSQSSEDSHPQSRQTGDNGRDLLAGLRAQAEEAEEDEEHIPDWLLTITDIDRKKHASSAQDEVHWLAQPETQDFSEPQAPGISATQSPTDLSPEAARKVSDSLPAWLAELQSAPVQGTDELSEWLVQARAEKESGSLSPAAPDSDSQVQTFDTQREPAPDWLMDLASEHGEPASPETTSPIDQPKGLPAGEPSPPWQAAGLVEESDQDWLARLQAQAGQQFDAAQPSPAGDEAVIPQEPALAADLPDWLKAAAPRSTFDETDEPVPHGAETIPDWLKLATREPAEGTAIDQAAGTVPKETFPPPKSTPAPAFSEESLTEKDMESLFTELPDWLSKPGPDQQIKEGGTAQTAGSAAIAPAELPSWVQAMRPVESSAGTPSLDQAQTLESRGALAGIPGVLPSIPGVASAGKPGTYSIKRKASAEQQAHAALMEKILSAEETPQPLRSSLLPRQQASPGWLVSGLLFLLTGATLLARTAVFRLPQTWPPAATSALQSVQAIPENSAVLVVTDYEPARAGEMEAAAAPLLDHMILLRHPRLTFVSTTPTGPLLAERLIAGNLLGGHHYQRGAQYANLGYLPGGLTGVLAFAQNPSGVKPFDLGSRPAWDTPALQGVALLSDFSSLVVITDSADSTRTWIEQAGPYRGAAPLVIVASAQSAPLIQPYYLSQQVNGLVSGLSGTAALEQNNAGRPGQARLWWDAYSLGLIAIVFVITLGGAWNLLQRLRNPVAEESG